MFQLFKDPKIDFIGKTRICVTASLVAIVVAIAMLAVRGINRGIEFTGGTEIQVKYADRPDVGAIRSALSKAGFANHVVTTIGKPDENEVYIRIGLEGGVEAADPSPRIIAALRPPEVQEKLDSGLVNLNTADEETLAMFLETAQGQTTETAAALAGAIAGARRDQAIFRSVDDVAGAAGMTGDVMSVLRARAFVGPFAVRSLSYVGPVIGREIVQKAFLAILGSLAGMLIYIWIRFEFQWGLAAVIALIHDTIITLGIYSAVQFEMSLPVVASFLTLIGYSVNDTVVVFDRIRENLKIRGSGDLKTLINDSINQTLSRTMLTSLLTWMVCGALFFLGGEALRGFSFVLVIGIIVGTYSSIYIAAPILIAWQTWIAKRKGPEPARGGTVAPKPPARKVKAAGRA